MLHSVHDSSWAHHPLAFLGFMLPPILKYRACNPYSFASVSVIGVLGMTSFYGKSEDAVYTTHLLLCNLSLDSHS